jgi:hypothetical protein
VQVKPKSATQLVLHPVLFPLSHCSVDALIPSPHLAVQVELAPISPVQVKPISVTQFEEHPVLFPLSHCSPTYNLLLPHICIVVNLVQP